MTKKKIPLAHYLKDRCPVCGTMLAPAKQRPLCVHVRWTRFGWMQALPGQPASAQEQKYSLRPQWRWKTYNARGERTK
jgi:hypothetical protein